MQDEGNMEVDKLMIIYSRHVDVLGANSSA